MSPKWSVSALRILNNKISTNQNKFFWYPKNPIAPRRTYVNSNGGKVFYKQFRFSSQEGKTYKIQTGHHSPQTIYKMSQTEGKHL